MVTPRRVELWSSVLISVVYFAVIASKYPTHYSSWFSGVDQGRYLKAAQAWAIGNLAPSQHYYPPGYPLLAAPFTRIFPAQPFVVANFICFLASFWIFVRICRHLTADAGKGALLGALAFLVATLSSRSAVAVWIWPWSTTGSAPFILGALLGALRFGGEPRPRTLFLTMASAAAVAAFRPADSLVVLVAVGLFTAWTWRERRTQWRQIGTGLLLAVAGAATPLLLLAAAHLAIFGLSPGPYLAGSAAMGFNWHLLPWRWVAIVVDPRPLFPEGAGLARLFPWTIPGIAGMALCLWSGKGTRGAGHVLIIGTMSAYWLLYLSYVDLQPYGLWRFSNYHYFKICQLFLAFYALLLAASVIARRTRLDAIGALLATTVALFSWKVELQERSPPVQTPISDGHVTLTEGLSDVRDVALVPAQGDWTELYQGGHRLTIAGKAYRNTADFKVFPVPGGVMILPLHDLPAGPGEVMFADSVSVDATKPVHEDEMHIVFGLSCLFEIRGHDCDTARAELKIGQ